MWVKQVAKLSMALSSLILANMPARADTEIGDVVYPDYTGAVGYPVTGAERELRPKEHVFQDERVVTDSKAVTSIRFVDDTILDVGSNSEIVLDELIFNPDQTGKGVLGLTTGAFRVVSGMMPDGSMTITTPTVTIGIRGTEIVIFVLADGTTEINLLHGALDNRVCESKDTIPLEAGQQLLVSSSCEATIGVARAVPVGIPQMPTDLANLGDVAPAAGGAGGFGPPVDDGENHGSEN